jgi:hypothetical protein
MMEGLSRIEVASRAENPFLDGGLARTNFFGA